MVAGLQRQLCANHPDRYGHALCMSCRKTVCQECATEWDGINYCVHCLQTRRRSTVARPSVAGWVLVLLASGLLFLAAWKLMTWGAVLLAEPWT